MIIGAPYDDPNCTNNCGSVFIFFGSGSYTPTSTEHIDIVPRPLVYRNSDEIAISSLFL